MSVETCAEQCVMEDSYLCRSFNYYSNSGMCSLFTENIVDKINSQIDLSPNEYSTHYSRQFYEKDGQIIKVEALTNNSQIFYTGGNYTLNKMPILINSIFNLIKKIQYLVLFYHSQSLHLFWEF